jgi:hypothetical protein
MRKVILVLAGASLVVATGLPAAAQQANSDSAARNSAGAGVGATAGDNVPAGTINKAGAALRRVTEIKQTYSQRLGGAKTQDEQQTLQKQATEEAIKAISDQGLTVDQYNQVIRQAQANPSLRERLLAAAQAEH